jgi:hypothetical protein
MIQDDGRCERFEVDVDFCTWVLYYDEDKDPVLFQHRSLVTATPIVIVIDSFSLVPCKWFVL